MSNSTKLVTRIMDYIKNPSMFPLFNFNKIENKGERIDIDLNKEIDFDKLNIFQKIHYRRYSFVEADLSGGTNCDIACGTGYGTILLSKKSKTIIGYDIDSYVIDQIKSRYSNFKNATFECLNIMNFNFVETFDNVVSFETLEHFTESDVHIILSKFRKALKSNGYLYFSVPYEQKNDFRMKILGHHKSFDIDEKKIATWLSSSNFELVKMNYQNYEAYAVGEKSNTNDIIVCKARKK
jgi:SAM-dependent methyltransferase